MNGYVSKRTNASQSFDYDELIAILDTEAKRPVVEVKRNIKLIDYSLAEQWLSEVGINVDPFNYKNDVRQVIKKSNESKETIGKLTLEKIKNGNSGFVELLQKITNYLGREDDIEKSDFIFVHGGKNIGRIQKAVELWKNGISPKIWISGGHPIYQEREPEAITFRKYAIENGVPEDCILIEPDSITISDNCRRSLNMMDEKDIKFTKMILIINWYAQKRAWMTMEKYIPTSTKLFNVNAIMEDDNQVSTNKWFESDYGINIVFNEFIKMQIHDILVMNRLI